jgi:hypothetical protein
MKNQPRQSWQNIRNYTEKMSWVDARSGIRTVGFNPPANAKGVEHVPFFIRYVTLSGRVERGECVTLSLNLARHQRMVQFIRSKEIRWVNDFLIVEVDGVRFVVT